MCMSFDCLWFVPDFINHNSNTTCKADRHSKLLDWCDCLVEEEVIGAKHVKDSNVGEKLYCGRVGILFGNNKECLAEEVSQGCSNHLKICPVAVIHERNLFCMNANHYHDYSSDSRWDCSLIELEDSEIYFFHSSVANWHPTYGNEGENGHENAKGEVVIAWRSSWCLNIFLGSFLS